MKNKREEKIFFENVKKIREFLDNMDSKKALELLINAQVFKDREDCYQTLCATPRYMNIINKLVKQDLDIPYLTLNDSMHKRDILETLFEKVMSSMDIPFKHFEIIRDAYHNRTYNYLNLYVDYYLTYHCCKDCILDLIHTCECFSIQRLNDTVFDFENMIHHYFMYVKLCKLKNDEDEKLYLKLKAVFSDVEIPLVFREKSLETIDLIGLNAAFNEVRPWSNILYDTREKEFIFADIEDIDLDDLECEENVIGISDYDIDHRDILERFIKHVNVDEDTFKLLYHAFHQKGSFRRCKELFRKFGILDDYYQYQDRMIKLCEIGWCIKNGFDFNGIHIEEL